MYINSSRNKWNMSPIFSGWEIRNLSISAVDSKHKFINMIIDERPTSSHKTPRSFEDLLPSAATRPVRAKQTL